MSQMDMFEKIIDEDNIPVVVNQYTPEGVKYDEGKPRFSLIPVEPLTEVAKVFTLGAEKYHADNWRKGMDWDRVFSAMMRHAYAWWGGETNDPKDGQHHLSSVIWCAMVLMWYQMFNVGKDTRFVR